LASDNGLLASRQDLLNFQKYSWETSAVPYVEFVKELSSLASRAKVTDNDAGTILNFIEKQPQEIRLALNNLIVTKGPYVSLRVALCDAGSYSTSYDKFQQKYSQALQRFDYR
jgi:hypothetical protein